METIDIRQRARRGEQSFGMVLGMTDPYILDLALHSGFHFVRIDCEHVLYDNATLRDFFDTARRIGLAAQIRVPNLHDIDAILALDPAGIVIPDVDSAEKAREVIDILKFPPIGRRSSAVTRRVRLGEMTRRESMRTGNDRLNLIVQIESEEGIRHIDEILSLEGIDMVASGRSDIAASLGIPGERDNPLVMEAENYIIEKALEYGKILTLSVSNRERMQELYRKGVYCYSIGRDEQIFKKALKAQVEKMTI